MVSAFVREGAAVVSVYLDEHQDAVETKQQMEEVAPGHVFLAFQDASDMMRQVLHPNGGEIVNSSSDR